MSTSVSSDVAFVLKSLEQIANQQSLQVEYNGKILDGNIRLTKEETQTQPKVQIESVNDNTYRTLVMIDPDAPSREDAFKGPALHWILANFQKDDLTDGQILYPYKGPGPGAGTGPHRYIFFLYQSSNRIAEVKIENDQRLRFPLEKYLVDNDLHLLTGTFCLIENPQ